MAFIPRTIKAASITLASATGGWLWYIRDTYYVPLGTSTEFQSTAYTKLNPNHHPPVLADHAVRKVPLSSLQCTDPHHLLIDFCRGIWIGPGFGPQRWIAKRMHHAKPGTEGMLWDKNDLAQSHFDVGTQFADHFEVLESMPTKITLRCGDSPLITGPREWDGTFTLEVTKDDEAVSFHLISIFFDSRPAGANPKPFPSLVRFLHKQYTCLWMETSVRRLGRQLDAVELGSTTAGATSSPSQQQS